MQQPPKHPSAQVVAQEQFVPPSPLLQVPFEQTGADGGQASVPSQVEAAEQVCGTLPLQRLFPTAHSPVQVAVPLALVQRY
jgi:hypothetical protein